jgi:hypothetical protein
VSIEDALAEEADEDSNIDADFDSTGVQANAVHKCGRCETWIM